MEDWLNAILPLVGVVVGAAVHSWFTRSSERDKHAGNLRSQAYVDYLRAVAEAAHHGKDARRNAADAKARIAVYGSAEVVTALARFEESGATLGQDGRGPFLALVAAMRIGTAVGNGDLGLVLLGSAEAT